MEAVGAVVACGLVLVSSRLFGVNQAAEFAQQQTHADTLQMVSNQIETTERTACVFNVKVKVGIVISVYCVSELHLFNPTGPQLVQTHAV